jgi:Tol biopolymer transport system component
LKKGDVFQFEIASGQKSQTKNKGKWNDTDAESICQVLSPDGKLFAYDSYTKDWTPQLIVRNLDGSETRILHCEKDFYFYPYDWSPDEKFILGLLLKNETNALTLISTIDTSVHILRNIPSGLSMFDKACFSPDGKYIAFSYIRNSNPPHGDIFLMPSNGNDEIVIAGHPSEDRLIGWTPDGKNLLFRSDRSGTWDIWTARITNGKQEGEPEMLKKDFGYYSAILGIAPNGSVYYRTETPSGGLYKGEIDLESGKVISTPVRITTRYTGAPFDLTWSPDGRFLLYLSRRGGIAPGSNILTIRTDETGEERFLSPDLRFVNQISWAPDGRSILAIGITEKETGIYRIDTETSATKILTSGYKFIPKLCPDGKTLVFLKGGAMTISTLNLETGKESDVTKAAWSYDISPDGKNVAFNLNNIVKTISLSGGEPRVISDSLALYYRMKWTNDGRYIIVRASGNDNNENSRIYRFPAQGGIPLKLDISVPRMVAFALHPDNRHFVYSTREESKSELWVMKNFLPK